MPPTSTKTLSPAELAKLEHAFATDPASDAYKPLAEAYLGMGRFMEAMVVCKKGVKAHPNAADPRVLLARVYAEQGKDKKALEELLAALQVAPNDKMALRMAGALQMKNGEAEAGKQNLLKAFQLDPADAETQALLQQYKVEPPRAASPDKVQAPLAGPGTAAQGAPGHAGRAMNARPPPPPPESAPSVIVDERAVALGPRRANGAQAPQAPHREVVRAPARAPAARKPALRPRYDDEEEVVSEVTDEPSWRSQSRKSRSKRTFFVLAGLLVLGVPMFAVYRGHVARRNREIKKALDEASRYLKQDTYDGYKKACEAADRVLDLDSSHVAAHGYLAYAYTIRWGEHGGGEEAHKKAAEHLEEAKGAGELSSHLYAAEALFKTYSGKGAEAMKELKERIKQVDPEGTKASLLFLTLGLIQMNQGDLEHARESLLKSQAIAPDDARVYAALGTLFRRTGNGDEAAKNFDFALRYQKEHPESMLGASLLILDRESPDRGYITAAKMLKRLIESEPPPSPRQLATAHLAKALLISRVAIDLPLYTSEQFRKELSEGTGVGTDKDRNRAEVQKAEDTGFSLDRNNPELNLIKGKRLLYENNIDGAVAEIQKAISIDGSRAHFHVELAKAYLSKQGREKEAEQALRKAISMIPNSPKLETMLGQALFRQGKIDEALSQFERAVKDPAAKNPEARYWLGRIYREKKDWDRAAAAFDKSAQEYVGQPTFVARSYDEAGLAYEGKGDRAKAQSYIEKALNADKDYEPAYCHYLKYLDRARAKELAREYLKQFPRGECASEMVAAAR